MAVITRVVAIAECDPGARHVRCSMAELRILVEHACETLAHGRAIGGSEGHALALHAVARAPRLGCRKCRVGCVSGGAEAMMESVR